jgi:predicted nuclease with TOPRIM domain
MNEYKALKSAIDRYRKAGYSDRAIADLHYLESRCEHLEDLLESYRHVQPDDNLFSEKSLEIIIELHGLEELASRLEDVIHRLQTKLDGLPPPLSTDKHEEPF